MDLLDWEGINVVCSTGHRLYEVLVPLIDDKI